MSKSKQLIALDIETDPFDYGIVPEPFVVGAMTEDGNFRYWWGEDCIQRSAEWLAKQDAVAFAHNGGKFDWLYYDEHIEHKRVKIINGRLAKANIGKCEIRDSYSIMPFSLKTYEKDDIDYSLLLKSKRDKARDVILLYLRGDCRYLMNLIIRWRDMFGLGKLTVGSAGLEILLTSQPVEQLHKYDDKDIRSRYYFGGRVECFKPGVTFADRIDIYDVNSEYPAAMRNFVHPVGAEYTVSNDLRDTTFFIELECFSCGAFAVRQENGSVAFPHGYGRYTTSIHEYREAIVCGLIRNVKIKRCINFPSQGNFSGFVDELYDHKQKATENGDKIDAIFYKYLLNAPYGKLAQDPEQYCDYIRAPVSWTDPEGRYKLCHYNEVHPEWGGYFKRKSFTGKIVNVAAGASVTGAARSILMRGIAKTEGMIYCDTDSIICSGSFGGEIHQSELGKWKLESSGGMVAVAGKKMYCLFSTTPPEDTDKNRRKNPWKFEPVVINGVNWFPVKMASKGVNIKPVDIISMCEGATVISRRDAPSMSATSKPKFIERRVKATAIIPSEVI